jgi:tetratricopeptide (TPR) repeat protein
MKGLLFSLLILTSINSYAETSALDDFYTNYKLGNYEKAIAALKNLGPETNSVASKNYLMATTFSKMQEYDQAIKHFELAIQEKIEAKDLYYEYGQALYANNDLKKSREAFKKSSELDFNSPASLYYVGHISQILEEYPEARKAYLDLLKNKSTDKKLEQIAKFQLAETTLMQLRQSQKSKDQLVSEVSKKIIPMLKLSYDVDRGSAVALDIDKRLKEILKEFDLDPDIMANGRRISSQRSAAHIDIKTKFDDNVTNTNLENDVQQSHKESFFVETEAEAKYDYVFKKRLITTPLVRFNLIKYSNQDESDVFKNDSMIFNFSLKNKIEITAKNKPSRVILDFDYSKIYKDYDGIHKQKYYSNSKSYTLGETFSFSDVGDTTFKFKYKDYIGYSESLNNHTTSMSLDQTITLPGSKLLIFLFNADMVDNYNSSNTNTNSYLFRFDHITPEILPTINLTLSLAFTLTDTLTMKSTRGMETTINPTVELSKDITNDIKGIVSIDYLRNKSKSEDYTYQKYTTNLELKYEF